MILGSAMACIAYPTKCDHETSSGESTRTFSDEAEREYRRAVFTYWSGMIMVAIGGAFLIISSIVHSQRNTSPSQHREERKPQTILHQYRDPSPLKPKPITNPSSPPASAPICEHCRHMVSTSWDICPNCGGHLEHFQFFANAREI